MPQMDNTSSPIFNSPSIQSHDSSPTSSIREQHNPTCNSSSNIFDPNQSLLHDCTTPTRLASSTDPLAFLEVPPTDPQQHYNPKKVRCRGNRRGHCRNKQKGKTYSKNLQFISSYIVCLGNFFTQSGSQFCPIFTTQKRS